MEKPSFYRIDKPDNQFRKDDGNGHGDGDGTCDETPETPQDGTGNQYGRNK